MAYRTLQLLRSQLLLFLSCTFSHSLLRPTSSYSSGHSYFTWPSSYFLSEHHPFHLWVIFIVIRAIVSFPRQSESTCTLNPHLSFNVAIFHLFLGNSQNFFSDPRLLYSGHCQFYSDHHGSCRLTSSGSFSSHYQVTLLAHVKFSFGPKSDPF